MEKPKTKSPKASSKKAARSAEKSLAPEDVAGASPEKTTKKAIKAKPAKKKATKEVSAEESLEVSTASERGKYPDVSNDPGSGAMEAPALAAWLPALAMRLLGEPLKLASVLTLWLGEAEAREAVWRNPERWLIREATNGRAAAVEPARLAPDARRVLLDDIARAQSVATDERPRPVRHLGGQDHEQRQCHADRQGQLQSQQYQLRWRQSNRTP